MKKLDLYESDPIKFKVTANGLRPPLASLGGVGESALLKVLSLSVIKTIRLFLKRTYVNVQVSAAVVIEKLAEIGALGDLPENNQIDLFG